MVHVAGLIKTIIHGIKKQVNTYFILIHIHYYLQTFIADPKKKEPSSMPSPIWISEEWQPWPDKNSVRFKTIGALYSEFLALSENGELHQWRWSDLEPYKSDVSGTTILNKSIDISMNR